MPIINQDLWNDQVKINTDPYGGAVIKVAKRAMEILDENNTPLHKGYHPDVNTCHGIICKADEDSKAGGITGFMSDCIAQIISQCHSRGREFQKQWNLDHGIKEEDSDKGVVNPAILTNDANKI